MGEGIQPEFETMAEAPFDVLIVTAGEFPRTTNLHASQVISPAISLIAGGHSVTWIAAVPLLSWLKDALLGGRKLRSVKDRCREAGIEFKFVVCALSIAGTLSFLFRRPVLRHAAGKLARRLVGGSGRATLLHARSYYAAHLACDIRSLAGATGNWRVSFDMRSIFPEELPLTQGWLGKASFGFAKQWEHELIGRCDVAFLPLDYARERYARESGFKVVNAPIQGFDRATGWSPDSRVAGGTAASATRAPSQTGTTPPCSGKCWPSFRADAQPSPCPRTHKLRDLECREYKHSEMARFLRRPAGAGHSRAKGVRRLFRRLQDALQFLFDQGRGGAVAGRPHHRFLASGRAG
jgi:hypothetical protein